MIFEVTRTPVLRGLGAASVPAGAWEEVDRCPVCGAAEHLVELGAVEGSPSRVQAGGAAGLATALCLDCDHAFRSRRPARDWLDDFYATQWDAGGRRAAPAAPAPKSKVLDFCREHIDPGAGVLDIGAGFGSHLLPFRDAGHPVHANERSEHRAEALRALGIETSTAPFEQARPPDGLGLAYSNHVLEHVDDPGTVLSAAAAALPAGGLLYTAVPNLPDEYPPQFLHYIPHISGYSLRSLTRLLADRGLRVAKAQADRELQVLAVKEQGEVTREADPDPDAERAGARERALARVERSFGTGTGARTLAWWKSKELREASYQGTVVRGGTPAYAAVLGAKAAHGRLPRRIRPAAAKALPEYVWKASTRMLHGRANGEPGLPVRVRHPGADAPVWVK